MIAKELLNALCAAADIDPKRVQEIRATPQRVEFTLIDFVATRENGEVTTEIVKIPVCHCTHTPDLLSVVEHEESVDGRG